jgi:hypothetical protein
MNRNTAGGPQEPLPVDLASLKREEPEIRKLQVEAMCRYLSRTFDSAAGLGPDDPWWLWSLRLNGPDHPDVKDGLHQAFKNGDESLRRAWGFARKPPLDVNEFTSEIQESKVSNLILCLWLSPDPESETYQASGLPAHPNPFQFSLCYYNDTALAKLNNMIFEISNGHNAKSIRKVWSRLGLKKSRTLLFKDVEMTNGLILPVPYTNRWKVRQ